MFRWAVIKVNQEVEELTLNPCTSGRGDPPPTLRCSSGSGFLLLGPLFFLWSKLQTLGIIWKEGSAFSSFFFFFSFLLFFSTLKEGSILVFPKREQQQQQGNEVASKFGPVPGTAQFSRLPYKNPGGKSVEAVGSFLLGSGGLWSDKRTLPQSPVYDWSVAERENTPNFFSSLASKSLHV